MHLSHPFVTHLPGSLEAVGEWYGGGVKGAEPLAGVRRWNPELEKFGIPCNRNTPDAYLEHCTASAVFCNFCQISHESCQSTNSNRSYSNADAG